MDVGKYPWREGRYVVVNKVNIWSPGYETHVVVKGQFVREGRFNRSKRIIPYKNHIFCPDAPYICIIQELDELGGRWWFSYFYESVRQENDDWQYGFGYYNISVGSQANAVLVKTKYGGAQG